MSGPLCWSHRLSEIPDGGLRVAKSASAPELAALQEALGVLACEQVLAEYRISALGGGRYRMSGKVAARLQQRCVVTLDALPTQLAEPFEVEFRPPDSMPGSPDTEAEILGLPEVEPIEHGLIDAGRVVYDTLAAALDPYPRTEGASLDWQEEAGPPEPGATGPFAKLKTLKKQP